MKAIGKVLISFVVIIVLFGAIGMIYAFINNGQKNVFVQYGNEKISYKTENLELDKNTYNVFFCKNVLAISGETTKATNYTVSIVANEEAFADCDFSMMKMDGIPTNSFLATDVTAAFEIHVDNGYFLLYLPETLTVDFVLSRVYPRAEITGVPDINLYEKDYFSILVYSEQEKSTITISFR